MSLLHLSDTHSEQHKKRAERVIAVALPRLQYRVSTHIIHAQTPYYKPHSQKMATAIIWLRAVARSLKPSGLDRKNTIVGKCSLMAATVYNKRFGASGALPRWKTSMEQRVTWLVASVCKPCLRQAAGTLCAMSREWVADNLVKSATDCPLFDSE